jgi:hypothetical protein
MTVDKKKQEVVNRHVREAQAYIMSLVPPDVSLSDELRRGTAGGIQARIAGERRRCGEG